MNATSWTVSPAPFLRTRPTVTRMSVTVLLTLAPQVILLALGGYVTAVLNVLAALAGSVLAETVRGSRGRAALADGTVLVSGILIGLLLPENYNPALTVLIAFGATLFARTVFGGTGAYWINPVAVAVSVAWISRPDAFPAPLVTPESIQNLGDAFGAYKLDTFKPLGSDSSITASLNGFFSWFSSIRLPEGYVTLFLDSPSPVPAFRFNLLILASSVILIALDATDWIVPASFLASYALALRLFTLAFPWLGGSPQGDILFGLLTGGMLFVAFYLLPDYSTSPRTAWGKALMGTASGLTAFGLCGPGGSQVGAVFTVLAANTYSAVIEYLENRISLAAGGRS